MENNICYKEITSDNVHLPRRRQDSHKGDYGRVLIIGGSVGFTGAAVLPAKAASRAGAGLVYAGVPKSIYDITAVKLSEEMPFPLPDKDGRISEKAADEIMVRSASCNCCLIGPGLGDTGRLVHTLICSLKTQLIIDADGLNAIANDTEILKQAHIPPILTPHPGEFSRLRGRAARHVIAPGKELPSTARGPAASHFAQEHNCILVLKGSGTVVAAPDGECRVNTTGGPALAKGGSGDVLAGMIAALIAQRTAGSLDLEVAEAVSAAVYLHGLAGDMCALELGEYSVTASDIIDMLPKAMMTVIER